MVQFNALTNFTVTSYYSMFGLALLIDMRVLVPDSQQLFQRGRPEPLDPGTFNNKCLLVVLNLYTELQVSIQIIP